MDNLIIRRSELDDAEILSKMINENQKKSLDLLFNFPKVLKLIETNFLSVTILDDDQLWGLLVFDYQLDIISGLEDFKHENKWEFWFNTVFKNDLEIKCSNSLFLNYIFIDNKISIDKKNLIMKNSFLYIFNTFSNLKFILFNVRKEVLVNSLENLSVEEFLKNSNFGKLDKKSTKEIFFDKNIPENINIQNEIWFCHRNLIQPQLNIRKAEEQDHDELAEIANNETQLKTDIYGEFFLAEIISSQDDTKKCLVAEINSVAVGFMCINTNIDYNLLQKNYELDNFDNLCKPEYMDAIIDKKNLENEKKHNLLMKKKFDREKLIKMEKLRCNKTALRIYLQEFLILNKDQIFEDLKEYIPEKKNDDKKFDENVQLKNLDKNSTKKLLNSWLKDFTFLQPNNILSDLPKDDPEINTWIMSPLDLLLQTLVYFGLDPKYIEGEGHWVDWEKNKKEKEELEAKKNMQIRTRNKTHRNRNTHNDKKPTGYDIKPIKNSLEKFLNCNTNIRLLWKEIYENNQKVFQNLFCEENGEQKEYRCVDILELGEIINEKLQLELEENKISTLGYVLQCFGNINYDEVVEKVKEKPKDDKEAYYKEKFGKKQENEKLIDQLKKLVSYKEFTDCLDNIENLDYILNDLNVISNKNIKEKNDDFVFEENYKIDEKNIYYENLKNTKSKEEFLEIPEEAKNAISINIFFINKEYQCRSIDFLEEIFKMFPNKDYLILTQPHTTTENILLQNFIQIPKQIDSNFNHVLYILNKISLNDNLKVRKASKKDIAGIKDLIVNCLNYDEIENNINEAIFNNMSNLSCYLSLFNEVVIGVFLITKDVNINYYKSHFCIQYHLLISQYNLKDFSKLIFTCVNPIFEKQKSFLIREILRLSNKRCFFYEVNNNTILNDFFNELTLIQPRSFPKLIKIPWDLEKNEEYLNSIRPVQSLVDQKRDETDEVNPKFSLLLTSAKQLSITKKNNNTRIVIIGASDTGLSVIESLLSIPFIHFSYIYLVSEDFPWDENTIEFKNKSINYNQNNIKYLLLESRVKIIKGKMLSFDRKKKMLNIKNKNKKPFNLGYDFLVISVGLVDRSEECLKEEVKLFEKPIEHLYSINDNIEELFIKNKPENPNYFLTHKKLPKSMVIYGRTLDSFCFIKGILDSGIPANRIIFCIPPLKYNYNQKIDSNEKRIELEDKKIYEPDAFEDEELWKFMIKTLEELGVRVYYNHYIYEFKIEETDEKLEKDKLECIRITKEKNINSNNPDDEIWEDCKIILTSNNKDIDFQIFTTIQDNGLVYNGRLIIKNNFQTTDPFIFACGKICEYSQRYKNFALGRSLRLDKYSGRELGQKLSRNLLEIMNILPEINKDSEEYEEIPSMSMPIGYYGNLPNNIKYCTIESINNGLPEEAYKYLNETSIETNNLDISDLNKQYYLKIIFDSNNIIKKVKYLGKIDIEYSNLEKLIGMNKSYLNWVDIRMKNGLISNLLEFLNENWAIGLYHEWFSEFRYSLKMKLLKKPKWLEILETSESFSKIGKWLNDERINEIYGNIRDEIMEKIKKNLKTFLKDNYNHLPMYYVPGLEFK